MSELTLHFVHGFMGHSSDWDEIRALIPDHVTLATDLAPASSWDESVKALCKTVAGNSVLVGYSMGARLALAVALRAPERCAGLVFVSGNPGLESSSERSSRQRFDNAIASRIETESPECFLKSWYDLPVFESLSDSFKRSEIRRKLLHVSADWPDLLRTNSISQQPNFWPKLRELSMPVLVMAGAKDEKYRVIMNRFSRVQSRGSIAAEIVPGCGHILHREDPSAFVRCLEDFIDVVGRHRRGGS